MRRLQSTLNVNKNGCLIEELYEACEVECIVIVRLEKFVIN